MSVSSTTRPARHTEATIEATLMELLHGRTATGRAKTICPSEVSRALEGSDEKRWRLLMKPVRRVAVRLARAGVVEIRRKNKPVDPSNFKGVYRIGLSTPPGADERASPNGSERASSNGSESASPNEQGDTP